MKWIISILLLSLSLNTVAAKKKKSPVIFIDNYWKNFEYYYQKKALEKFQSIFFPKLPEVFIYGGEKSLLQRKLLSHEVGVPAFFNPSTMGEEINWADYLSWINFSKKNPKELFPDIIQSPIKYNTILFSESYFQFGLKVPINQ